MDPFLKCVGGKRWLATKLVPEIMGHNPRLYVEPFGGGGAVALTLPPELEKWVSDLNVAFVAVWHALKCNPSEQVLIELHRVERAYPNTGFGFVKAVEALNEALAKPDLFKAIDLRLAALTLYVNVRCYNGLWRVNKRGLFNVPWGKYKTPRRFTLGEIKEYHQILQNVHAEVLDFREQFERLMQDKHRAYRNRIVVYADPPYDSIEAGGAFTSYTAQGFDEGDQRDLAAWLRYLSERGMRVFATNADTPLIRELYAWASIEEVIEQHSVGATAARRGGRKCLLIRS
jgi:DNA adenine methylase